MRKNARTHCKDCGVELNSLNETFANGQLRGNRAARCKVCSSINKKKYYQERVSSEQILKWNMKAKYGITPEEYNQIYEFQQFGCAICRQSYDKLYVDHDHETGEVRDLLCARCNLIVSYVENYEDLVINAVEYLKRHNKKKEVA